MLAGVSSILCIACLFMGVSLLNNISRVRKLETEIATVQNSYYAMAEQLEEAQTQMVFAAQRAEQQEQLRKEAEEKAKKKKIKYLLLMLWKKGTASGISAINFMGQVQP